MSMHAYLKASVTKLPGFRMEPWSNGTGESPMFGNIKLTQYDGRIYIVLSEDGKFSLPIELQNLIEEYSIFTTIPHMTTRETGLYQHRTAKAEINLNNGGENHFYKVRIMGEKLEDVKALLHMIKVGSIRPAQSYETPQGGVSRQEMHRRLQAVESENTSLKKKMGLYSTSETTLRAVIDQLHKLREELFSEVWPWGSKQRIRREIKKILDTIPR